MNITQEFRKIFGAEQTTDGVRLIDEEQDVLLDVLLFMRDDAENGMGPEIMNAWGLKLTGVIEYLEAVGKITEEQEAQLAQIIRKIGSVEYE